MQKPERETLRIACSVVSLTCPQDRGQSEGAQNLDCTELFFSPETVSVYV